MIFKCIKLMGKSMSNECLDHFASIPVGNFTGDIVATRCCYYIAGWLENSDTMCLLTIGNILTKAIVTMYSIELSGLSFRSFTSPV